MRRIILFLLVVGLYAVSVALPLQRADAQDDLSTEEAVYLGRATAWLNMIGLSYEELGTLLEEPEVGVITWENDVLAELGVFSAVEEDAKDTDEPRSLRDVHDSLLEAFELSNEAAVEIRAGLEAYDASRFENAAPLIEDANAAIDDAVEALEDFAGSAVES
jgi:hypothetical protein